MLMRTFLPVIALLSTMWFAALAQAAPSTFNVDGVITNSSGAPLETASVTFRVEIKNSTETCVLYREDQIVNMTGSNGYFSIAIGKTANLVAGGATLEKVFSNQGAVIPGESCTYTPAGSTETRKFIVSFNDGATSQVFASQEIQSVPFALEAAQASRVGQYSSGEILKADSSVDQTTNANSALSQTQYDEFWRLVKNPGSAYLPNSTALGGDVTGPFATNSVVKIRGQSVSATVPTAGQILTFTGGVWTPTTLAPSGVASVTASLPLSVSGTSTANITISQAGAASDGYLSQADWNTFNNKQSSSLANGKFLVGNSSGVAAAVTMAGDATLDNAGALTLSSSGVTAGTYSKVTVDAKGRVTMGANLVSSDIISLLGYTPVNKAGDVMSGNLSLVSVSSDPAGLVAGDEGKMWYRSDLNTIRYWDGSSAISLGVAGAGITNLNGLTSSSQSFVIGTAGNFPSITSTGSAHTLDIPMASSPAVTAGLISKSDYDAFNAKQSSSLASAKIWVGNSGGAATAVSMSGDATIDNSGALSIGAGKITAPMLSSGGVVSATSGVMIAGTTGNLVNFACATSGHVLKWSVTGWTCAFPDATLPTLASGKVWVGNAGGGATEVTLSGDASIDNAGAVTLASSGVSAGSYAKVVVDSKGRVTAGQLMSSTDITSALNYTPVNKAGDTMLGNLAMGGNDITNTGNISMAANKYLGLSANPTNGTVAGQMWYDSGTIKYYDGSVVKSLGVAGAGITTLNGLTAGTQTFTTGSSGTDFNINSTGSGHTFNIPTASASNRGALSSADWSMFNNKMSSSLASAQIWVGNASGGATAVSLSGDITSITNAGVVTVDKTTGALPNKILALDGSGVAVTKGNQLNGATSGSLTLIPAAATSSYSLTFPGAQGASGQVLSNNGSGLLSWTSAMTNSLASAKLWVGNSGGAATAVTLSGDASIDNTGAVTLASSGVSAGSYAKVVVDSKGRVTAGQLMSSTDITSALNYTPVNKAGDTMLGNLAMGGNDITNTGNISMAANKYLGLSANPTNGTVAGQMWYDSGTIKYYDGSSVKSLGVAGAGITALNGLTAGTQTFGTGSSGTDFNISSVGSAHTFNIPTASSSNRGALSSADWSMFNSKQSSTLSSAKLWVGNAGGAATAVSMSGDATMDNAGALTLASSGVTAGSYSKVVVDSKGRVTAGQLMTASDITSALGFIPASTTNAFINGGNSFGGAATLGTNDAFALKFKTNNSTKMTIDSTGNVGIGTMTPSAPLEVTGRMVVNSPGTASVMISGGNDTTSGSNLTFVGESAGSANTTGGDNTFIGTFSGAVNTTGYGGTFVGSYAGSSNTIGTNNTFIGSGAGYDVISGNNNVIIGSNTGSSIAASSNNIIISDGAGAERIRVNSIGYVGIGTANPNSTLDINGAFSQRGMATPATSPAGQGRIYFDSTANKFKVSQNGGAYTDLVSAGGGITSLNGLATSTQTFTTGSSGTDFNITSAGSAHTFNIPTASASNRGALSSADWSMFNAKQSSTLGSAQIWVGNSSGTAMAVSMSGDASISNAGVLSIGAAKITAPMLSTGGSIAATTGVVTADTSGNLGRFACSTNGHVATWSATGWSCAFPMPALPGLANANIWVGNSGTATPVNMNGDAIMSNTGTVTLASSGVATGTYSKVAVDVKGRVTSGGNLVNADITGALGYTPIGQGGNSFGAPMSIGTTDANNLTLTTNSSPRLTFVSGGGIGIGTTTPGPTSTLTVTGTSQNILKVDNTANSSLYNAGLFSNSGSTIYPNKVILAGQNFAAKFDGHLASDSTVEVATVSGCGSGGSVAGTDTRGTVTVGTSTSACTVTFHHAFSTPPFCVVGPGGASGNNPNLSFWVSSTTAASFTISTSISVTTSFKFTYICME